MAFKTEKVRRPDGTKEEYYSVQCPDHTNSREAGSAVVVQRLRDGRILWRPKGQSGKPFCCPGRH